MAPANIQGAGFPHDHLARGSQPANTPAPCNLVHVVKERAAGIKKPGGSRPTGFVDPGGQDPLRFGAVRS